MSHSSVWFHWLGIDWTATVCLAVAGAVLMLLGVCLFVVLFKHVKGKIERMSEQETRDMFDYGATTEPYVRRDMQSVGPIIGVKAVLTANIDTLRRAARRGDWLTFWLWPSIMSCWCIGMGLLIMAILPREPILIVVTWLIPAFIVSVAWFMAWAAIYTNIDLNADAEPAQTDDPAQSPKA